MIVKIEEKIDKNSENIFLQTTEGDIFKICEGTGDSLLQEDIDEGYVDYIYFSVYSSLSNLAEDNELDGGMVLLKKLYKDMSLEEIVRKVEEEECVTFIKGGDTNA